MAGMWHAHNGRGVAQDGDAVAIFNFRADRVLEISRAFEYETFDRFDRKRHPKARPCVWRANEPLWRRQP